MAYKRYKGIRGDFWKVFSQYIRMRDFAKHGTCISCGVRLYDWKDGDCGHFIAAGHCGFKLIFDEQNNNLQCKKCNNPRWTPDAGVFYAKGIQKRYGAKVLKRIHDDYDDVRYKGKITKEWTKKEYALHIEEYRKKIEALQKEHGLY